MSKHVGLYIYAGLAAAFALGSPVRVAADTLSSEGGGEAVAIAASKDIESVAHGAFAASRAVQQGPVYVDTAVGLAPVMPERITLILGESTVREFVNWDVIPKESFAKEGEFEVKGTAAGVSVVATVTVSEAVSGFVVDPVLSAAGVVPTIGPKAGIYFPIKLKNGHTIDYPYWYVKWQLGDKEDYRQPGIKTVTGYGRDSDIAFTCDVEIVELDRIEEPEFDPRSAYYYDIGYNEPPVSLYGMIAGIATDGRRLGVPVEWEPFPEEIYTTPGTYVVRGTAAGFPFQDAVISRKIIDIHSPRGLRTLAGVSPVGLRVDGEDFVIRYQASSDELDIKTCGGVGDVAWKIAEGQCNVPGVYSIQGEARVSLPGGYLSMKPTTTLTVYDELFEDVPSIRAWAIPGRDANLPETVNVFYRQGDMPIGGSALVDWDQPDTLKNAAAGDIVEVGGTVRGTSQRVKAEVLVDDFVRIALPKEFAVAPHSNCTLPNVAQVVLASGARVNVPCVWSGVNNDNSWNLAEGESTVKTGSILLPDGTWKTVDMKVVARAFRSVQADWSKFDVVTNAGVAPSLPEKVPVVLADGSISMRNITWEDIEPAKYSEANTTFQVKGYFDSSQIDSRGMALLDESSGTKEGDAIAEVSVTGKDELEVAYGEPIYINVENGDDAEAALEAYKNIDVYLSDGSRATMPVQWVYSEGSFDNPGSYSVMGQIRGASGRVVACVTVNGSGAMPDPNPDPNPNPGDGGTTDTPQIPDTPQQPEVPEEPEWQMPEYSDVEEDWYTPAVEYVVKKDIMTGYGDTKLFGTHDVMTREQFANMVFRFLAPEEAAKYGTVEECEKVENESGLADVADGEWFTPAINWCVKNGVLVGYEGVHRFGVGDPMSREAIAVALHRISKEDAPIDQSNLLEFNDGSNVSDWARGSLSWAVKEGVVCGTSNGELMARSGAERCMVAAFMTRYDQRA